MQKLIRTSFRALAVGTALGVAVPVLTAQEAKSPSEMTEAELYGYVVAQQVGLDQLGFTEEEKAEFAAGFEAGLDGSMAAVQGELQELQAYLEERSAQVQSAQAEENKSATQAKIAELRADPDIIEDRQGFFYEVLETGNGNVPTMQDQVTVNYEGTLLDGEVFDSSYNRGQPATFPMSGVIPGFSGGLSKISEGGRVRIYIPSELGYGDNPPPQSPIPPGAMLIFDAELEGVAPAEQGAMPAMPGNQ
jgi:FKBP-type peptidyl-prolyl cis-trans isomerase